MPNKCARKGKKEQNSSGDGRFENIKFQEGFEFPFDLKINIAIYIDRGKKTCIFFTNNFPFSFCRHKRKMPNFWPCKSLPKRNGHLDSSGVSGGHSVAYEDPDAHLHHHPLVRHHNMEVILLKRESKIFIISLNFEWKRWNQITHFTSPEGYSTTTIQYSRELNPVEKNYYFLFEHLQRKTINEEEITEKWQWDCQNIVIWCVNTHGTHDLNDNRWTWDVNWI